MEAVLEGVDVLGATVFVEAVRKFDLVGRWNRSVLAVEAEERLVDVVQD